MSVATSKSLQRIVRAFRGRRVVVLGDLVADEFLYGDIDRVSREAPVLILSHRRTIPVPGAAGNAVANLRALGARPIPVGIVGRDGAGERLVAALRETGVATGRILATNEFSTPTKRRILAGGVHTRRQQIVRIDGGSERGELPPKLRTALRRSAREAAVRAHAVLVADYGYGAASPRGLERWLSSLHRRGVPVTVDSRTRVAEFRQVTACTPNQEEVENALGTGPLPDRAVDEAGRRLLRRTGNQAALVTRGAKGMSLFRRRQGPVAIPAFGSDEVADVTGAGDTVIATFTLALASGGDEEQAARLANYAAGIAVTKAGTATVSGDELIAAIEEDETP